MRRSALRLTDEALAELRAQLEELAERFGDPEADGTWTRILVALVDLEDRAAPHAERSGGGP